MKTYTSITVPAGCTIALTDLGLAYVVLVAPPGLKPEMEMLTRRGTVAGVFTFDDDLAWPNSDGCVAASAYLAAGCPIGLFFEDRVCAVACHDRLVRVAGR